MAVERKKPTVVFPSRQRGGNPNGANGKLESLTDLMGTLMEGEFTGYLKINFSQGGISRVEKFEEISKKLNQ